MANKKIKKVKIGTATYDLAVDGVDKVDGLEERLDKLENNKQAAISDLATIRSNASTGATHAATTHARTDATKVEDSTTNGNIKINGTETNVYTHPAYTSKAEGLYKVTVDATGHISKATAVTKTDITNLGIPGSNTNTTYDLAAAKSKSNGYVTVDLTAGGSGSGKDSVTIKGTGATTVTTDANGVITINSTDNNTVYTHPTHTSKASGLYKVTVDGTGHVSAATAVTKSDITSLGIPGSDTNTTYTIETGDSKGQIKVTPSSGDAYNVDVKGLGSAAYTNSSAYMPAGDTSHGTHVSAATVKSALGTGTGTSKYLREDGAWVTPPNTTYSNATTAKAGLMSSTDKSNLDALVTAWTADGTDDTLINKVEEVVKAFKNAPEGTNIVTALAGKADKSSLATVATSGSYNDLSNKPTIPTVNNATLTLNVGGQAVSGNNAFTANDATNTTYNVPSATASAYGVVKVSSVNSSAVTVNSESTIAGRYYPVELNSDGKAIVNVPWTDTDTNTHNSHKINSGKKSNGSTDIISAAASSGDIILGDSGVAAGTYKRVTVNAKGIVVGGDNTDADTNTWRKVQLNGTDKLGAGTDTKPLNIKAGSNMTITESNGTFTFAATDTNTDTNQKVKAGSVTFGANDEINIVAGSNVTVTGDATNKKITIAATDTNTHYTTGLFVGATNTKSNAATSNGGTYLKLYDNDTRRAEFKISGSGATKVTSDANGNIVISSTDNNTDTHYTKHLQIKGNGTEAIKYTQDSDKSLNLKPGNNVSISAAAGEITISATDTNTWRPIGTGANDAAAGNHTHAYTPTSVLPNDSGEIKTKYRIAKKDYTGGASWYYEICKLPKNDTGNYASAIISGRIGGWESSNMSYINALIWNRGTPGLAVIDVGGTATAASTIWNICDLVLYTNSDGTATLYAKCAGYFTFDLDLELFQSTANITYSGNKLTSVPGTLNNSASATTSRMELINGELFVSGTKMSKSNHSHDVSIAASSGTNELTLAHGTKYALTAGGQSFVFTMPSDNTLVSNTTASGGIKYITEASFTNGVLKLESKYLHLS